MNASEIWVTIGLDVIDIHHFLFKDCNWKHHLQNINLFVSHNYIEKLQRNHFVMTLFHPMILASPSINLWKGGVSSYPLCRQFHVLLGALCSKVPGGTNSGLWNRLSMVRSMPGFLSAMITTIASITTVSATVAAAIPAIAPISPTIAATMATIAAVTPVRNSQTGSHTDRGNDQQYQQLKWRLKIHTKAIFVSPPLPSWHLHGDGAVDTGDISIVIDDLQKKSTTSIPISKKLGVWIFFWYTLPGWLIDGLKWLVYLVVTTIETGEWYSMKLSSSSKI